MDGQGNSAPLQGCPSAAKDVAVETPMKHYMVSFALPSPSPSKIQMDKLRKELMKGLWLIYLPSETVKSMYLGFLWTLLSSQKGFGFNNIIGFCEAQFPLNLSHCFHGKFN